MARYPGLARFSALALISTAACAQPHEIDLAARPNIKSDALVTVWTHDGPVELSAVTMSTDSIWGLPVMRQVIDTHRVVFALKDVSRVVVTQAPSPGSTGVQAFLIAGIVGFLALVGVAIASFGGS
jgi:hypothetical protein